jgi:SAM-dependent methyltransferase
MKPRSTDDVLDLLDASFDSAALGAAMELGLFWLLEARPRNETEIAARLGIPLSRCHYWLQLLRRAGLVEKGAEGYEPSSTARSAILEAYDQGTWALLAHEARERLPGLSDLPVHLREPGSVWRAQGLTPPMYVDQMGEDPDRARRFTRMLYELHQPLAKQLAGSLDLSGVTRLMDLGGGSGVISLALLRRYPNLTSVVVDIPNVCAAGREIAVGSPLEDRITFQAADLLSDDLPSGFDVVLECDVNAYSDELFDKVRDSLNPGGRFVLVDQFAPGLGVAPVARVHWALAGSLIDADFAFPTVAQIRDLLEEVGFLQISDKPLAEISEPCRRFSEHMVVIEARR